MTSLLEIDGLGKQLNPPSDPWLFHGIHAAIAHPTTIGILGKSGHLLSYRLWFTRDSMLIS